MKNANWDDYDEKYMKIRYNLADDLPLEKTLEMCNMAIVIRSVFNDIGSINPSIFRWMFVWIRW